MTKLRCRAALISVACVLAAGCGVADDGQQDAPAPGQGTGGVPQVPFPPAHFDESLDPNDDPELQAMLRMPGLLTWKNLGNQRYERTAEEHGPEYETQGDKPPRRLMIGMITRRGHYVLEFDRARTSPPGEAGRDAPPGQFVGADARGNQKGWSDGTDNRTNFTGVNVPMAVGRVGNCTGALIGDRIVRLAAHCLFAHGVGGGTFSGILPFNYREDNSTFGVQTTSTGAYYGINYQADNCDDTDATGTDYWAGYRANLNACTWDDFGYLILPTNWSNGASYNYFGYRMMSSSDLGLQHRHGGYPVCTGTLGANGPASCVSAGGIGWYWEDQTSTRCTVSSWILNPNKWYTGCDTSSGHSGGPVWEQSTSRLLGHVQWQDCDGSACGSNTAPNRVLGHDQSIFDFQQWLRATYPP